MSKYTGPIFKKSRRYNFSILENDKEFQKGKQRNYPPGQHGQKRQKYSDFGLHLREKQKVRYLYGLSEKQLYNFFKKASKLKGIVGNNFLTLLEKRFDNIVYRAGIAQTRKHARQLVNHRNFKINGKNCNIPSKIIDVNDVIVLKEKYHNNKMILSSIKNREISPWIKFDKNLFTIKLLRLPERSELNSNINESLIVEFYNK